MVVISWEARSVCFTLLETCNQLTRVVDYWFDTSGFKIEHYADGDLVNVKTGTRRSVAGPISVWGPELPKDFGEDGTSFAFS